MDRQPAYFRIDTPKGALSSFGEITHLPTADQFLAYLHGQPENDEAGICGTAEDNVIAKWLTSAFGRETHADRYGATVLGARTLRWEEPTCFFFHWFKLMGEERIYKDLTFKEAWTIASGIMKDIENPGHFHQ